MSVTVNGTSGLVFGDGTIQGTAAGTSFRNRAINGDMRIHQRGALNILTTGGTANYPVDRFAVYPAIGSKLSVTQASSASDGPVGFNNYIRVRVISAYTPTSTLQYFLLEHQVEGYNWADLEYGTSNAKTCTVSFWIRSSVTGTYSFGLRNAALNRAYVTTYTINAANTWEYKTITIPGDTTGSWEKTNLRGILLDWDLGSSSDYLTSSSNQWIAAGTQQYASTTGTKLITNQSATLDITGVQVEKAGAATSFEHRSYGTELALCQRYYQIVGSFFVSTPLSNEQEIVGAFSLYTPMRSQPSSAGWDGSFHRPGIAFYNITGINAIQGKDGSGYTVFTIAAGAGTNTMGQFAGLFKLNAEL